MSRLLPLFSVVLLLPVTLLAAEPPLVEKFLTEGKLAEGERALEAHLKAHPRDDQARFGQGTLQFLRAPSLLNDYRNMENAIGGRLSHAPQGGGRWLPIGVRAWLYRFGQHRGYLDAFLSDYVARPVLRILSTCDAMERRWTDFLSGGASRESDAIGPSAGSLEDLS